MSEPDAQPARRRGRPPGSGKGSVSTIVNRAAIAQAKATGQLPHEILLDIARGTPLVQPTLKWDEVRQVFVPDQPRLLVPDLQMRLAAARDAAPYFAPKLSAMELLASLSDDELSELIAISAAEAGVGLGAAGESPATTAQTPGGRGDPATPDRPLSNVAGDHGGPPSS